MKKIIMGVAIVILSGLTLSGCSKESEVVLMEDNVVVMEGEIKAKSGDEYVFYNGNETVNITSNKVNLDDYMGKNIEVSGMFSGSTLYVDEVSN